MAHLAEQRRGRHLAPTRLWSISTLVLIGLVGLVVLLQPGPVLADSAPVDTGAWQQTRAREPANVAVFAPSWLPAPFRTPPIAADQRLFVGIATPIYRVAYHGPGRSIIVFALGPVNSGPPAFSEAITVHGANGQFEAIRPGWWPEEQVRWQQGSWQGQPLVYTVQAIGVSRAEMLDIAASLMPVPIESAPGGMPAAGGGGAGTREQAVLLAFVLGGGLLLVVRLVQPRSGP